MSSVSVSVPIWLTLTRIAFADALVDPAPEALDVGDEQVVADELDAVADPLGQRPPARPVVLGQPVLDRDERIPVGEPGVEVGHRRAVDLPALEPVDAVGEELGRGRVERDRHLLAVAGPLRRLEDRLDRLFARAEIGREAALVADRGREARARGAAAFSEW